MKKFEEMKFNIGPLKGISAKNIEEHLKLYAGYVKNANLVLEKYAEYAGDTEKNAYVLGELQRRFSFEFNGMRNHEIYFSSLAGGAKPLPANSKFKETLEKQAPSFEVWLSMFKLMAMTRGIGWAIIYWDPKMKQFTHGWVDEQHLGHLLGLTPILMLDMWEHSYVADYQPSGKKQYVEDFFANLNWEEIEKNFTAAQ